MTSDDVQRRHRREAANDSRRGARVYDESLLRPIRRCRVSQAQLENGRLMPVATELRAVWDAMRPSYQALLGGAMTPEAAAAAMQRDALEKIELMHRDVEPERVGASRCKLVGLLLLVGWIVLAARQLRRASSATGAAIGSPTCSCCRRWS